MGTLEQANSRASGRIVAARVPYIRNVMIILLLLVCWLPPAVAVNVSRNQVGRFSDTLSPGGLWPTRDDLPGPLDLDYTRRCGRPRRVTGGWPAAVHSSAGDRGMLGRLRSITPAPCR